MAYDQELAERIAGLLGIEVDERRMFGGLAFMVGADMALAGAVGRHRCGPARSLPPE